MEYLRPFAEYYYRLLSSELHVNEWVQDRLSIAEPIFRIISYVLEPGSLFNLMIPLAGIYRQHLLIKLIYVVSLVSTLSSFIKWVYPETRPLWWLRELYEKGNYRKSTVALQNFDMSCETSGGMPCAHSMCLTVFFIILNSRMSFSAATPRFKLYMRFFFCCCMFFMWLSRLYLATEFLHQVLLGSYIAICTWRSFERYIIYYYTPKRNGAILIVGAIGCLALAIYFLKLGLGLDPHWSVRQAFKWCPEPTYMRHEGSPIFLLARDLGNLMGVALSSPLLIVKSYHSNYPRRAGGITFIEICNYVLRSCTPKQHGRFVFLAYEFTRNALHSLILLKYFPTLINETVQ